MLYSTVCRFRVRVGVRVRVRVRVRAVCAVLHWLSVGSRPGQTCHPAPPVVRVGVTATVMVRMNQIVVPGIECVAVILEGAGRERYETRVRKQEVAVAVEGVRVRVWVRVRVRVQEVAVPLRGWYGASGERDAWGWVLDGSCEGEVGVHWCT